MMNPTRRNQTRNWSRRAASRRRGSVLVVVLALLSALMLLGFLFYTSASQERANARAFSASEKFYEPGSPDPFDPALEQVLIGPDNSLVNSILWSGRYSILANMVGTDITPNDGTGVNVVDTGLMTGAAATGIPTVNQNHDNAADPNATDLLTLHMGEWAMNNAGSRIIPLSQGGVFPEPDSGYSYPDLDSLFLAYVGTEPVTGNPVVLPSYHRPQYLRGQFAAIDASATVPSADWYINPLTSRYTLRPHQARPLLAFDPATGNIVQVTDAGGNPVPRFAASAWDDTDTMTAPNPLKIQPDPEEGYWDWTVTGGVPTWNNGINVDGDDIDYEGDGPGDGDADGIGDGINEGFLVDLGLPVEQTPDGQKYIRTYGITIYDLDSLLNLNAHGNLFGLPDIMTGLPTPSPFISHSNEGRHPHEVNPIYGFTAPGSDYVPPATASEATGDEPPFFGAPAGNPTTVQLANIEFWFTMAGRATLDGAGAISESYVGLYGEKQILEDAYTAVPPVNPNAFAYPRPGTTLQDDPPPYRPPNWGDMRRGMSFSDPTPPSIYKLFPSALQFLAPGHPEDHQGQGSFVGANGWTVQVVQLMGGLGSRLMVPAYVNYWVPTVATDPNGLIRPEWMTFADSYPVLATMASFGLRSVSPPFAPAFQGLYIDDPGEVILDADQATSSDSIFGPGETAAIHMSGADRTAGDITSRLLDLVPANFKKLERSERFTTISRDLKSFSSPDYPHNDPLNPIASTRHFYERRHDLLQTDNRWNVFPPYFGTVGSLHSGFRTEARRLLQQSHAPIRAGAPSRDYVKGLIRKLSVNQVAAQAPPTGETNPEIVLRPLTPHPTTKTNPTLLPIGTKLPSEQIPTPNVVGAAGTPVFGVADQVLINAGIPTWNMFDPATLLSTGMVDAGGTEWPAAMQEWHARRDRQNMARDIYTLLYLTSFVGETADPTANPVTTDNSEALGRPVYSDAQMREMAQFAVNVVDAMDADDTITLFVYDKNLYNGYTPLDDGYDDADPVPFDGTTGHYDDDPAGGIEHDRGMVFGVEAQQLAFSEVLAMLAKENDDDDDDTTAAPDYAPTLWDDTAHRDFVFAELQNMTPGTVTLDGGWSIVCEPVDITTGGTLGAFQAQSLTILGDSAASTGASGQDYDGKNYTNVAQPGETFTIGVAGDDHLNDTPPTPAPASGTVGSVMIIDKDEAGSSVFTDFERIAPAATNANGVLQFDAINAPNTELRVNAYDPANPWDDGIAVDETTVNVEPGMTGTTHPVASDWLQLGVQDVTAQDTRDDIIKGSVEVKFTLRRRANLHRDFVPPPASLLQGDSTSAPNGDDALQRDNPWIVVDVCTVPLRVFDPADTGSTLLAKLQAELISDKRPEPLDRGNVIRTQGTTPADRNISDWQANSLGGYHGEDTANPAQYWQRHFDRSFASIADLLMVPLYGPGELTKRITTSSLAPAVVDPKSIAAARFLYPDGDPRDLNDPLLPPAADKDTGLADTQIWDTNLWYRLFEFVEVPDKSGNPDGFPWFLDYAGTAPWGQPGTQAPNTQRYGKINLNMVRHPHVLAGLLDDPRVINPALLFAGGRALPSNNTETMNLDIDGNTLNERQWWHGLLYSRDGGYAPFVTNNAGTFGAHQLILPGLPSAEPFRGASTAPLSTGSTVPTSEDVYESFSKTFLRTLAGDDATPGYAPADAGRRALFELGAQGGTLGSTADFASRYRLLGKVLKHGTTRSNTYVIFMTCDYHVAEPVAGASVPNVYQIGEKIAVDPADETKPRFRGVFVVDRTRAMEMLEEQDLPNDPSASYQTFSYTRTGGVAGGSGEPTFDWSELILYRKTIEY